MIALIIIDVQNDFLPGGALGVPQGDEVIPVINRLIPEYSMVIATADWHPADHQSFASQHAVRKVGDIVPLGETQQVLWPDHCVQGTLGSDFSDKLDTQRINHVVRKGTNRDVDSYSGFFDNDGRGATGLESLLRESGIQEVHLVGLATDYCVKFTALDAVKLGFQTKVIQEAVRGVDLQSGDCERAFAEMRDIGVDIVA
ncbi:nicotinamidase/pyrazinamidase [Rubripirellula obstinata]|uniref:Nicotinamidase n=1 Tax=Rubripirellula obstinata TaxID=406547 RepID=A0A5B1CNL5_9BACT|nr:bifunctional nicotinamidase/pyrazinamidase [Rubripirellula obstinata]KAA1262126.1 nicotinamidase/pyrazinamidase [Rubripirellula obstinata]